jgi:tRNA(Ile)-lysidine synthase
MSDLLARVLSFCDQHRLLRSDSRGLIALSGGPDSLTLTHLLARARRQRGLTLGALVVDHGLRAASAREARAAAALAEQLGVDVVVSRLEGLGSIRGNLQERARTARLRLLESHAERIGADWIALGHSANDQAETVLMRLVRGSGGQGLSAMAPRRGRLIRPLLATRRRDIEAYLAHFGLMSVQDPTNETDHYTRNRLRRHVLPSLQADNPNVIDAICRAAEMCREDHLALQKQADAIYASCQAAGGLLLEPLRELDNALLFRVLRRAYADKTGNTRRLSREHVIAMAELARGRAGTLHVDLPKTRVERRYDRLHFGSGGRTQRRVAAWHENAEGVGPPVPVRLALAGPGEFLLPDGRKVEICERIAGHNEINCLSREAARFPLQLATPTRGLRMRSGVRQHKKISRILQEARVPAPERALALVVESNHQCLLLVGIRRAFGVRPHPREKAICVSVVSR